MIRFGSVCSGIEAASSAWLPLGWQCSFMSEIEQFPRAVLSHHYPGGPLHGDFTTIKEGEYQPIDVLVGGTPCQSFSVAGLRGGLADERGNLALEYLRLAERLRPRWLVWENVPGVLSSGDGRDFGAFVGGLAELGYGWAYRVLDAQYFGLAQRRKRVFVVGCLGDWRRAAAVLFEPTSLRWHPAPSREAGKGIAPTIESGVNRTGGTRPPGTTVDTCESLISLSLNAHGGSGRMDGESETFVVPIQSVQAVREKKQNGIGIGQGGDEMFTLTGRDQHAVAFAQNQRDEVREMDIAGALAGEPGMKQQTYAFQTSQSGVRDHDTHATLDANNGSRRHNGAIIGSAVRRLTPRECERLMGFPDDYTLIPYRGRHTSDGPRYRALGNSMAVPVMAWIGRRIDRMDEPETLGLFDP